MSEMLSMPKRFGTLLCADSTVFEENTIEEFFYIVHELFGHSCPYKTGATKIVLDVDYTADYIVKFPLFGYYWESNEDEPADIYYSDDYDCDCSSMSSCIWHEYGGAFGDSRNDYCKQEFDFYEKVCKTGEYGCMFPKTEKVDCRGITYYKQERCYSTDDDDCDMREPSNWVTSARTRRVNNDFFSIDWVNEIERLYGEDFAADFIMWAKETIDDLHSGNYGYSAVDGRPVILDWGGYNG